MAANPRGSHGAGRGRGSDTRASTMGLLPDAVAAGLVALVSVGILLLGVTLGYGLGQLLLLILAGLVAAVGVRTAAADDSLLIVLGVSLLWLGALAFTAATGFLASQSVEVLEGAGVLVPFAVAVATLLGPFGIVGSTVMLYGHGVGRLVLRRYFLGSLVLVGLAVLILVAFAVRSSGLALVADLLPSSLTGSAAAGAVFPRAILGLIIYTVFRWVSLRATEAFPAEVLVSPGEFDRVAATRERIRHLYRLAKYALVGYVALLVGTGVLLVAGQPGLAGIGRLALFVISLPALLTLVSVAIVVLVFVLGVLRALRSAKGLTEGAVAEILVPPLAVFVLAGLVTLLTGGQLAEWIIDAYLGGLAPPGTPLHGFLTVQPTAGVLLVIALALVFTAVALSVPTVMAGKTPGDASLAGIASSVFALAILLVLVILAETHVAIVVAGVLIAAVVWEFGEYSMVAAGELWDRTGPAGFPRGYTRLAAIHAASTAVIVFVGIIVAGIAMALAGGSALPVAPAVFIVISSSLAIAALTYLLIG